MNALITDDSKEYPGYKVSAHPMPKAYEGDVHEFVKKISEVYSNENKNIKYIFTYNNISYPKFNEYTSINPLAVFNEKKNDFGLEVIWS